MSLFNCRHSFDKIHCLRFINFILSCVMCTKYKLLLQVSFKIKGKSAKHMIIKPP